MKGTRPLNNAEIQAVSAAFEGQSAIRNRALFMLGVSIGGRINELLIAHGWRCLAARQACHGCVVRQKHRQRWRGRESRAAQRGRSAGNTRDHRVAPQQVWRVWRSEPRCAAFRFTRQKQRRDTEADDDTGG